MPFHIMNNPISAYQVFRGIGSYLDFKLFMVSSKIAELSVSMMYNCSRGVEKTSFFIVQIKNYSEIILTTS